MLTLQDIYNHYAAPISPGDPKIMRLNRFIDLITASGVCDDNFGAREIGVIYNLSMMTQVDEIHNTRHMDMRFIEFVEAIARVADKAMTRKTQEYLGRDPSQSGITGPGTSKTPDRSKTLRRDASEASLNRSRSLLRDKASNKNKSKAPSIEAKSDHSDPLEIPIGKEIKHPMSDLKAQS